MTTTRKPPKPAARRAPVPPQRSGLGTLQEIVIKARHGQEGDPSITGVVYAYVTEEVDHWGKRTVHVLRVDGDLDVVYLFADEWRAA